jgi:hypothetical protein
MRENVLEKPHFLLFLLRNCLLRESKHVSSPGGFRADEKSAAAPHVPYHSGINFNCMFMKLFCTVGHIRKYEHGRRPY